MARPQTGKPKKTGFGLDDDLDDMLDHVKTRKELKAQSPLSWLEQRRPIPFAINLNTVLVWVAAVYTMTLMTSMMIKMSDPLVLVVPEVRQPSSLTNSNDRLINSRRKLPCLDLV